MSEKEDFDFDADIELESSSEDWSDAPDDFDESSVDDEIDAPPPKKSGLVFYLLIAAIVLGGVYYLFFAEVAPDTAQVAQTESPEAYTGTPVEDPMAAAAPVPAPQPDALFPPVVDESTLNGPAPLDDIVPPPAAPENITQVPLADPLAADSLDAPATPAADALNTDSNTADTDVMAELSLSTESVPVAGPGDAALLSDVTAAPEDETLAVDADSTATPDTGIAPPPEDDLFATVLDTEVKSPETETPETLAAPEATETVLEEAPATAATPVEETDVATTARLAEIEAYVDTQMAAQREEIDTLKATITELEYKIAALSSAAAKPEPTAAPAVVKPQPKTVKPPPAAKPAPKWELRSAKAGEAWVSAPGVAMRVVRVGDTLPGLGRITDIEKNDQGLWVVRGRQGMVKQ